MLLFAIPLPAQAADKLPFILIHGGWGGGQGWWKVKSLLEKQGHRVFAPSLPGQGDRAQEGGPHVNLTSHANPIEIGRASCWERVCPYVCNSVCAASLKKKKI